MSSICYSSALWLCVADHSHSPSSPFLTIMHPLKSVAVSAQVIIFSAYEGWKALATNTEALIVFAGSGPGRGEQKPPGNTCGRSEQLSLTCSSVV